MQKVCLCSLKVFKGIVSPQNENDHSDIIYSLTSCQKHERYFEECIGQWGPIDDFEHFSETPKLSIVVFGKKYSYTGLEMAQE